MSTVAYKHISFHTTQQSVLDTYQKVMKAHEPKCVFKTYSRFILIGKNCKTKQVYIN